MLKQPPAFGEGASNTKHEQCRKTGWQMDLFAILTQTQATLLHLVRWTDPTRAASDQNCQRSLSVAGTPRLDLRFVLDEQSFAGRAARDVATEVPPGYVPPPAFATAALQHTNVKLTWDADDVVRKRALARKLTQEQLHEDDFRVRSWAVSLLWHHSNCMAASTQIVWLHPHVCWHRHGKLVHERLQARCR